MKTYQAHKRISPELKKAIRNTLHFHDRYKEGGVELPFIPFKENEWNRLFIKNWKRKNPAYKIKISETTYIVKPHLRITSENYYYSLNVLQRPGPQEALEAGIAVSVLKSIIN